MLRLEVLYLTYFPGTNLFLHSCGKDFGRKLALHHSALGKNKSLFMMLMAYLTFFGWRKLLKGQILPSQC